MPNDGRWNHKMHYGRQLLDLIPAGATRALDVGCGEGWFVRELREHLDHVIGLDPDEASIAAAHGFGDSDGITYIRGEIAACPLRAGSFDVVTAIASRHHFDEKSGLERMAELLRPGGLLGVVGLARTRSPRDLIFDLCGAVETRLYTLNRRAWETPAPKVWPPPHFYHELRDISEGVLSGRQFARRAMWRYVLTWVKPDA